ncbi:MAG: hypothetical protein ACREQQ_04620 [Candidatus Binatia bacterium]
MQNEEAVIAFYRALGFQTTEHPHVVSVYAGDQMMINFQRRFSCAVDSGYKRGYKRAKST